MKPRRSLKWSRTLSFRLLILHTNKQKELKLTLSNTDEIFTKINLVQNFNPSFSICCVLSLICLAALLWHAGLGTCYWHLCEVFEHIVKAFCLHLKKLLHTLICTSYCIIQIFAIICNLLVFADTLVAVWRKFCLICFDVFMCEIRYYWWCCINSV